MASAMISDATPAITPTTNPTSWRLPVVSSLISGTGALFGGCGLGAAIEVMEQVTGSDEPDPALVLRVGALFLRYREYDRAAVAFEKLVATHNDSAEVWRMLAETYDRQSKPEQAYRAYSRATAADLLIPRLLAGEPPTAGTVAKLGHGGVLSREMRFRFPAYALELEAPEG